MCVGQSFGCFPPSSTLSLLLAQLPAPLIGSIFYLYEEVRFDVATGEMVNILFMLVTE